MCREKVQQKRNHLTSHITPYQPFIYYNANAFIDHKNMLGL